MHHNIIDHTERTGTIIGTTLGALIGIIKHTLLITIFGFEYDIHNAITQLIEGIIICIPTAAIGAAVGYYTTKLLKKLDRK